MFVDELTQKRTFFFSVKTWIISKCDLPPKENKNSSNPHLLLVNEQTSEEKNLKYLDQMKAAFSILVKSIIFVLL